MSDAPAPAAPPTLLVILGPPAVGKMTVGQEVARRTGMRLFHNHLAIDPVLRVFDFGTPPFLRLVDRFRQHMMDEAAASALPGLVFTFVRDFDEPRDTRLLERYAAPFRERGGRVLHAELAADAEVRLQRNEGASRLAEKATMRDLDASRQRLSDLDREHRLNSAGECDGRADWLRMDTTHAEAAQVAARIVEHFGLG